VLALIPLAFMASAGASSGWSGENFEQMNTWFKALTTDTFG
jgi:hypothetical protein